MRRDAPAAAFLRLGSLYGRRQEEAKAFAAFDKAQALYDARGNAEGLAEVFYQRGTFLNARDKLAEAQEQLRYREARETLDRAFDVASRPGGVDKQLLAWIHLYKARMALSELRYAEALAESRKASALGDAQDKDFSVQVSYTRGLAALGSGTLSAGQIECQKAVETATRAGVPRLNAGAQLAQAEVLLASGDALGASGAALQAQETFARLGQRHSEWRAWLVAARASRRLPDEGKVREYAARAAELLTALERAWGANDYSGYLSRPDVLRQREQLDELLPGAHN